MDTNVVDMRISVIEVPPYCCNICNPNELHRENAACLDLISIMDLTLVIGVPV